MNYSTIHKFLGEYLCSQDENILKAAKALAKFRYARRPENVKPPKIEDYPEELKANLNNANRNFFNTSEEHIYK